MPTGQFNYWKYQGGKAWRYWFCSCRVSACRCFCQDKWLKLGFLRDFNPIWTKPHKNMLWYCLHGPRSTLFPTVVFTWSHCCNETSLLKSSFSKISLELAILIKLVSMAGLCCTAVGTLMSVWLKRWEYFGASGIVQIWRYKLGFLKSYSASVCAGSFLRWWCSAWCWQGRRRELRRRQEGTAASSLSCAGTTRQLNNGRRLVPYPQRQRHS